VALAMRLRALERRTAGAGDVALADDLDDLARELDAALAGIRELARGIRPPLLVEGGLEPALAALADVAPVAKEIDVRLPERLPDAVEATLYFIAGEAVANALRHAGAKRVCLSVAIAGEQLVLTVSDDGAGGADPRNGTGLLGLADRLEAIGGTLEITSDPGAGTTLRAFVPQPAPVARR
jgi:signal transduction histidine kinase